MGVAKQFKASKVFVANADTGEINYSCYRCTGLANPCRLKFPEFCKEVPTFCPLSGKENDAKWELDKVRTEYGECPYCGFSSTEYMTVEGKVFFSCPECEVDKELPEDRPLETDGTIPFLNPFCCNDECSSFNWDYGNNCAAFDNVNICPHDYSQIG